MKHTYTHTHTHTYIYKDQLKNSLANQDAIMKCDQMRFTFNIVLLKVHTLLPSVLLHSDFMVKKVINSRYIYIYQQARLWHKVCFLTEFNRFEFRVFHFLDWSIGLMSRVFNNGLGDWGSIPGWVITKTQKMVLDATLLNT